MSKQQKLMSEEEQQKLICIGIIYQDKSFNVTSGKCKTLANKIKEFYRKNSRGLLQFDVSSAVVKVPYTARPANVNKAEQFAINKFPGFDIYAIVVTCISASHAGAKIAHLENFLVRTGAHEVGHILNLGHAGNFDNKFVLDPYGDALSVMGKYPSEYLTAPQYEYKKWCPKDEIAIYSGTEQQTFTVKRLINFTAEGLSMVKIPKEGRPAFISFPQGSKYYGSDPYLALHLQNAGGSQKIKTFKKELYDSKFTGLHIKVISATTENITFTVDYNTKDSVYKDEEDETNDDKDVMKCENNDDC